MAATDVERKARLAATIKTKQRVNLPRLKHWNYEACEKHDTPRIDCQWRKCGGEFFDHQTRSIAFLYAMQRGLDASVTGAGKTLVAVGLLALLKERGELTNRAVIICQTPAVMQWVEEAARWTRGMRIESIYSGLTPTERAHRYMSNFDVLIVGFHMALRDKETLAGLEFGTVISDDVDPLLNQASQTHDMITYLSQRAQRSVVFNATSIQTNLGQIHAATMATGGFDVWGSRAKFDRRYVKTENVTIWERHRKIKRARVTGYKNVDELKRLLAPMVIRATYDDFGADAKMPDLMPPTDVWLELHPEQRKRYTELQEGVLRVMRDEGTTIKQATALTMVGYGQQICAGLPALGEADGPQASSKLDWVMQKVQQDWQGQKVLCFIKNVGMVAALQGRLDAAGVGYATIWGRESDPGLRQAEVRRFWEDDNCSVMLGTAAIERSLNLQNANLLVCVDTHLNPARMTQILGRIRRTGSKHKHVFVFNLFARDTQEEQYGLILRSRQAVSDYIWEEESELYEALSPMQMLQLIGGRA